MWMATLKTSTLLWIENKTFTMERQRWKQIKTYEWKAI